MHRVIEFKLTAAASEYEELDATQLEPLFRALFTSVESELLAAGVKERDAETRAAKAVEAALKTALPQWWGKWGYRMLRLP